MTNLEENLSASRQISQQLNSFLIAQSNTLYSVLSYKLDERANQLKVILGACCCTTISISELGKNELYFYNEYTMLSRALIERLINFCYLLVCDDAEFNKYFLHTVQKSYRKLNQKISIGDDEVTIKFSGDIDRTAIPKLEE